MQTQNRDDVSKKNIVILNCFFFWSHGLVLLLSAIPIFSQIVSILFHISVWTVPKTYELKMYAAAMFICLIISMLSRYAPLLFFRDLFRYRFFILIFYPCSVFIYSLSLPESVRFISVFAFSLIGLAILIYDLCYCTIIKNNFFSQNYNSLLITAILFSIVMVIYNSAANTFNLFSVLAIVEFISIFAILRFINIPSIYFISFVPVLIFIVTFGSMQDAIEVTHYSFFLGPIIEILYGNAHPLNLDIQYGGGLTLFLALYFKIRGFVSFVSLQELLKFLTFIQFLILYFIAASLYRSYKIAFLTVLALLFFSFFGITIKYYYSVPSIGFLRFGIIYLILLCYTLEGKIFSSKFVIISTSILGSIAVLWSFESSIYTLPALLFSEYINKNLKKFLPVFLGCFCIITFMYLSPFFLKGSLPPLWRYNEYAMLYANGFGQLPLNRLTSFWWLFPLLYGFSLIKIITGNISNKIVCVLTIYGMAIFTYFGGRSHPCCLLAVSIPFILLSIYFILNLKSLSFFIKQILLAAAIVVFSSAYYVVDSQHTILQGVWKINMPLIKDFLLLRGESPFLVSDAKPSLHKAVNHNIEMNCSIKTASPLKRYLKNNALAILSMDDITLLHFFACTKSHNELGINPYSETAFNPKAVDRVINKACDLKNSYILVQASLLESQYDPLGSEMTTGILRRLHAKKVDELFLDGEKIEILRISQNI